MTRLRHDVLALVITHCIAHREALSTCNAYETLLELLILDQLLTNL